MKAGEIHLWHSRLDLPGVEAFRRLLSPDEAERMERFKMPQLRARFAIARGTLRVLAAKYLGRRPEELSFTYGEHGKPALDGVHFNLSHSADRMAVAFSFESPIGLDIEQIAERLHARDIAGRYFSDRERRDMETSDEREFLRRFFRLWTAKEAVMKATSLGFALELSKIEIGLNPLRVVALDWEGSRDWQLLPFHPADDFAGTLACRPGSRVELREFLHE